MARVLLDATAIPRNRAGVGRYLDSLVPALAALDDLETVVVSQAHDVDNFAHAGVEVIAAPARIAGRGPRLAWEQTGLPAVARRVRADVLHCPHYTMPLRAGLPTVVTLHDATFFTDPSVHTRTKGPFFRTATRLALRRATECIVDSHASGAALERVAGARPGQLHVAHLGVDLDVFSPPSDADVAALRAELGLASEPAREPYVAFLGTHEPRKNLPELVRGFAQAAAGRDPQPTLVLAGGAGWETGLDDAIAAVGAVRVIRPGYLALEGIPALLGGASVLAYPSLDEGFGLPVLEAMACGAAVLTTRRGALPEVGGDAVAYTETDAASIGTALTELLDDPTRRAALGRAGIERAAGFSWAACAQKHRAVYLQAAHS